MSEVKLERSAQLIPDRQAASVYDFAPTKLQARVCSLQFIVIFTSYVNLPETKDSASYLIESRGPVLGFEASGAWNCNHTAPCLGIVFTEIFTGSLAAYSRKAFSLEHSISVFL